MLQGKVRAAIKWLTDQGRGRVFNPNDSTEEVNSSGHKIKVSVMDVLRRKHPEPTTPPSSALIDCDNLPFMESVEITGSIIQRIATIIQGSAGPGGCDANHWQDALLRYGAHSAELRESVASAARRLANNLVSWPEIRCLMASRLVALDKCPGVRPIGIGETLRRLIGKAVGMVTRYDVEEVCGTDQLCAGMRAGIEGAVHAIKDMFDEHKEDGWGVLLVDATNAFNSINRRALLWNARVLWPRCSRFLFNTYRGWAPLILKGSPEILYSREGVTQGDPLSMFLYAVGTLPLIRSIRHPRAGSQVWYADDASACAELPALCDWFHQLLEVGPKYGYFPEPKKSFIVVGENHLAAAQRYLMTWVLVL